LVRSIAQRTLTTLHGRQDLPDLHGFYLGFSEMPLVSISQAQRQPVPHANFVATVQHGLPADLHAPVFEPRGGYLAYVGRTSPEKRLDRAVRIARRSGIPLKIAAKVAKQEQDYFHREIEPLLGGPDVEFVGEIHEREKRNFLGDALALLFPIDWPEPFGLAMIEAMACATPVLAFRCGAVPEVIDEGVTGFIVDTEDQAVAMVPQLLSLDRRAVRQRFEARFTARRMANDYIGVYRALRRKRAIVQHRSGVSVPALTTSATMA
jgi:glycosyltransferase involved in cell wall biosynthesis